MIKHHSHPPGPRGFSEIQQHAHPVVKFETLEENWILLQSVFFYFLKVWLSQAQFSDMKTQQGWKICVIKYKWSKADFDFDFLTVDCQTMYKSQFKQSACRFWRSCSQIPSWSTSCILLYHIGPEKMIKIQCLMVKSMKGNLSDCSNMLWTNL